MLIAAERLMELEDNPIEKQGKAIYFDEPCGIRIKNMSYCYADEPDKKVIDNLSYTFPQGSCTAILGQTGAGKTADILPLPVGLGQLAQRQVLLAKQERGLG